MAGKGGSTPVASAVRVLVDPVCPWTYRTAQWLCEVRQVRPVEISWGLLSLEYINREQPGHPLVARFRSNRLAMRLLLMASRLRGNTGLERLYLALATAVHHRGQPLDKEATLADALLQAGLPGDWLQEVLHTPQLDQELWVQYEEVSTTGAFGVPTLFFGESEVPYYGPVLDKVSTGEEAGDLWDHVAGLARHECFYELKRPR